MLERYNGIAIDEFTVQRKPADGISIPYTAEMQEAYLEIAHLLGLIMGTNKNESHNIVPTEGALQDLERKASEGKITLADLEQWTTVDSYE